jgi:hypothetical protein
MRVLRLIEATDQRCRMHHISAATGRAALDKLEVPLCGERQNGWDLLRGSDRPQTMTVAEAQALLTP